MSDKYLVYNEKRSDIHKPIYIRTIMIKDITDEELQKALITLREKYDIIGWGNTPEEVDKLIKISTIQSNYDYIPHYEEAIRINSTRPIIVFTNDTTVVYPGFYQVRACDYDKLKTVINIRFVTVTEEICNFRNILFVHDINPFKHINFQYQHIVLKTNVTEDQINKWVIYNMIAFRISIRPQDKDKIINNSKTLPENFEALIQYHMKYSNLDKQLIAFEFPFEIEMIMGNQFMTAYLQIDATSYD